MLLCYVTSSSLVATAYLLAPKSPTNTTAFLHTLFLLNQLEEHRTNLMLVWRYRTNDVGTSKAALVGLAEHANTVMKKHQRNSVTNSQRESVAVAPNADSHTTILSYRQAAPYKIIEPKAVRLLRHMISLYGGDLTSRKRNGTSKGRSHLEEHFRASYKKH